MRRDRETLEAILHGGFVVLLEGFEYRVKLRLKPLRRVRGRDLRVHANHTHRSNQHRGKPCGPHFFVSVRLSSLIDRPAAESLISWARRFSRVGSCFALITR